MFPPYIQKLISNYLIFGFLPLDKFLHFVVGALITVALRTFKVRMRAIFMTITILCLIKEIIDYPTLNSKLMEGIVDCLFSFIYPVLILIVIWGKERLQKKIQESEQTIQK